MYKNVQNAHEGCTGFMLCVALGGGGGGLVVEYTQASSYVILSVAGFAFRWW